MASPEKRTLASGERLFASLGRALVRHPWYPVIFWVALFVVALPFLGLVGSVTTNSATQLPDSAPSSQASAEIARLFPTAAAGTSSLLLFTGPNITGPLGQRVVVDVTSAITHDPSVQYLAGVESLYTAYQAYLSGATQLALATWGPALAASPSLPDLVNGSAWLLWSPSGTFLTAWQGMVEAHPTVLPSTWNYPAYVAARSQLTNSSASLEILSAFYNGANVTTGGFNGTLDCAAMAPAMVTACADLANRLGAGPLLPVLLPAGTPLAEPTAALQDLGIENFTTPASQRLAVAHVLGGESGLPAGWLLTVGSQFPTGQATPAAVLNWTTFIATEEPVTQYPLPIPSGILATFVDPAGDATIAFVAFTVDDSFTTASGSTPVFDDVGRINRVIPSAAAAADPTHSIAVVQTGVAALDQRENSILTSSIALVLPLTVITLVLITMLYFRSPVVPLLTFSALGIAIALGIAGVVMLGTLVSHVDQTSLTLENTFVLGVGTDYAIFLVARYREEIHHGASPEDAVVTSVTWAGQSIATSGATAVLATLALTFSGVALLSQWGMVLSFAVLMAVLVSLTLIPSILVLLGPRLFWPATEERLRRRAARHREAVATESTYFYRVGRAVSKRPGTVVAIVLVASLPLLYVAVTSTTSYDFFAQLPRGDPSTDGLALLSEKFGNGFSFPIDVLVTFASPLVTGVHPNVTEFLSVDSLTSLLTTTPGVALVHSPVGATGATLPTWLSFPTLPFAAQAQLNGTLSSFVGTDGETVWFTVYSDTGGLTLNAVNLLRSLESRLADYQAVHPEVTHAAFGGGAAVNSDIATSTGQATERMAIFVSAGLVLVLLVVLRSYLVPLLAVATIGLSIGWAWGVTNLVLADGFGLPLFYFVPTVMFILILGLGTDYNIFLLTRVREERLRGHVSDEATVHAVARTGGIITAAAVILASAFAILLTGEFVLLQAIGFAVAVAIVLDATVVRTYLVPASLILLKEKVWVGPGTGRRPAAPSPGESR